MLKGIMLTASSCRAKHLDTRVAKNAIKRFFLHSSVELPEMCIYCNSRGTYSTTG